jgi:GntR family transcriptional regulator
MATHFFGDTAVLTGRTMRHVTRSLDTIITTAINPNTVLKAYRELETKGLTAGRPGQGTFIQATLSQVTLPELAGLRRSMLGWLASADAAGLDEGGVAALFTSVLRDFYKNRGSAAEPGARTGETGKSHGAEGVA